MDRPHRPDCPDHRLWVPVGQHYPGGPSSGKWRCHKECYYILLQKLYDRAIKQLVLKKEWMRWRKGGIVKFRDVVVGKKTDRLTNGPNTFHLLRSFITFFLTNITISNVTYKVLIIINVLFLQFRDWQTQKMILLWLSMNKHMNQGHIPA